jgi:protein-tyrosine phosphatase
MTRIQPHALWVGHAEDGRDFRAVFDAGIQAIVQLAAEELPVLPPRDLVYCRFPLLDGGGNDPPLLRLAIRTVAELVRGHVPVLVTCGAGMSRSRRSRPRRWRSSPGGRRPRGWRR